jgi:hypothetical protein
MRMFTRHVSSELAAFVDGELAGNSERLERHLAQCAACRMECDEIRWGIARMEDLRIVEAPPAIWASIDAALNAGPQENRGWFWRWAVAAVVVLLAGGAYWRFEQRPQWDVVRIEGTVVRNGKIGAGEWMETDLSSRASIKIGEIGSVEVEPNTRVRVVTAKPGENRLTLARGEIHAKISAPPRMFFVDTAAGTAVDLGCEYALRTQEDGSGLLRVTTGWVSFEWNGMESLVPAGASCRTRTPTGPGIPYFDDAPETLKRALETFSSERDENALNRILGEARVRDTLTLWHLLARVKVEDRERVYDRMAALTRVPSGVSREKALQLDPETLKHWKEELAWTW